MKVTLAFFHSFYNILNSTICLLLLKYILLLSEKIYPDKDEYKISAENLNKELLNTPSLALESARLSMIDMNEYVLKMYNMAVEYFNNNKY